MIGKIVLTMLVALLLSNFQTLEKKSNESKIILKIRIVDGRTGN